MFGLISQRALQRSFRGAHFLRAFSSLPEFQKLELPALSPTMTEGSIASWHVSEGDEVAPGDVYADIETDKASVAFECQDEGFIAKILVPENAGIMAVGTTVAIQVEDKDDIAAFANYTGDDDSASAPVVESTPEVAAETPAAPVDDGKAHINFTHAASKASPPSASASSSSSRVFASPLAQMLASEAGVDLASVAPGTGPEGRIIEADVRDFININNSNNQASPQAAVVVASAPASTTGNYTDIPLTGMRKAIASRLLESKNTVPHYYVTMDCEMDELVALRAKLNHAQDDSKVSVNDFIIKASALALKKVPEVNSQWTDSAIRQFDNVDICVAVATPAGLITPIVTEADRKGLGAISSDVKALAQKARDGELQPHEFQGGTFTISNLGMFGVDQFTAIINPPQACILAVGAAKKRIVPVDNPQEGELPFRSASVMSVTLSSDHRVVDGAVAAQWLQQFKHYIENPTHMIL